MTTAEFMTLAEAAKSLPGKPHVSTLHRWARRGVGGVRLQTWRVGRRTFTTDEAVAEFLAGLNLSDDGQLEAEGC